MSSTTYVSTYFSPHRGVAETLIGFIDRCQKHICVAVYSITHDDIANALIRAHNRGVSVRVLTDKMQAGLRYADADRMRMAGIEVRLGMQSGSLHNKFVLGDGTAVGTGSFNWSTNADQRNAENFVIIRLKYIIADFQREFDHLWDLSKPSDPQAVPDSGATA